MLPYLQAHQGALHGGTPPQHAAQHRGPARLWEGVPLFLSCCSSILVLLGAAWPRGVGLFLCGVGKRIKSPWFGGPVSYGKLAVQVICAVEGHSCCVLAFSCIQVDGPELATQLVVLLELGTL